MLGDVNNGLVTDVELMKDNPLPPEIHLVLIKIIKIHQSIYTRR